MRSSECPSSIGSQRSPERRVAPSALLGSFGRAVLLSALLVLAAAAAPGAVAVDVAAVADGPAEEAADIAAADVAALLPFTVTDAEGPQPLGPPATEAANTSANASPTAGTATSKFSMIIVFRDATTLARLRMMCNTSPLLYRLFYRALRLPADCHMPGVCKRIYSQTISGFAGEFGDSDLARLERCLPPSSVFYREPDAQVYKAEDSTYWHPPDEQEQQHRQQQQGSKKVRHRASRRMQQVLTMPRVEAFEERQGTPSSTSGPIDMFAISQGRNISNPGPKVQTLTSQQWNLDRVDQRELPLDGRFAYGTDGSPGTGRGVTVYVVDSGLRLTHQEFRTLDGSRSRASHGYDFVEDDYVADDCDGHGTHVSGTAVGLRVGMAKEAEVVAVRILDCTGSGTISDTVAALDWVAANHRKPAVVTLSLGIQVGSWSRVLEDAVRSLINDHGVNVVVASGNSGVDACYVAPANVPEVVTVSATNLATKHNGSRAGDPEESYRWSNSGPCIDVWAPGVDIFSACGGPSRCDAVTDSAYTYASGTSMAVPLVAGVAATYLGDNPGATPSDVSAVLKSSATLNKVTGQNLKPGTPNRLLYSWLNTQPAAGGAVQAASGP